jgi:hypothetical protein
MSKIEPGNAGHHALIMDAVLVMQRSLQAAECAT